MGISCPNVARSLDNNNRCVRFTGYDGMFEIKFHVATDVLGTQKSDRTTSEGDYLTAFDALRPRLLAATTAYSKTRSSGIMLDLSHFR